jgi:hypothetical protein
MVIASSKITYSTLFRQSHANIYNLINNRNNVPDPISESGDRKFVYTREPKNLGRGFSGFPFIIVFPPSVSQNKHSKDLSKSKITYDIDIMIYTQDKDSDSSGNPTGIEQLDQISENIIKTINSNRKTLVSYGMANFEMSGSDFDVDEIDGRMVYTREFNLVFSGTKKVVA